MVVNDGEFSNVQGHRTNLVITLNRELEFYFSDRWNQFHDFELESPTAQV